MIFRTASLATLTCLAMTATAYADDSTLQFKFGAFQQNTDVTVASGINDNSEPGTELSLEDLGHDNTDTNPWFSATWQLSENWQLWGNYSSFSSGADTAIDFSFDFGDLDIPQDIDELEGTLMTRSDFDANVYVVNLGYNLYQSPSTEVDLGLGLHVVDMAMTIDARVETEEATREIGTGKSDVSAPLPNVVLFASHDLGSRWTLSSTLGWLSLKYDEYDGSLTAADVEIDYTLTSHIGIGAGYRWVDYSVTQTKPKVTNSFDANFSGPTAYVSVRF
jgi:hypothetical protein